MPPQEVVNEGTVNEENREPNQPHPVVGGDAHEDEVVVDVPPQHAPNRIENSGMRALLRFVGNHPFDIPLLVSGTLFNLLVVTDVSILISILASSAVCSLGAKAGLLVRQAGFGDRGGSAIEQIPGIGVFMEYRRRHNNRVGPAPAEANELQGETEVPPADGANLNMVHEATLDNPAPGADGDHSVNGGNSPPAGRASPRVTSGAAAALDPSNVRGGGQPTL